MNFNGGKTPMYIFGVDIDKLYEDIKLYKNLPEFCHNLMPRAENNNNNSKIIHSYDQINDDYNESTINSKKNHHKKKDINKIVERLTKVKTKKKEKNELKIDLFFKNNNLSGILPFLSSFSTKDSNNNKILTIKRIKKKRAFRNNFNLSLHEKKDFNTSYYNNLSNSKIIQDKSTIKTNDKNEYIKKWNLPNIFKFDKFTGREKEKPKNPNKFKYMQVAKRIYSPKYNYIDSSSSNSRVNYSPDYKKDFNKVKTNLTRKIICNSERMRNSSSERLYIIDIINDEKRKKRESKIKKIKEKYGKLYDFLNYDKNRHKLKLSLINKNKNDF